MLKNLVDHWWLVVIRGLVGVVFGIALIAWPLKTLLVVITILGIFLLLDGVIATILSFVNIKRNDHWWVLTLQGVIEILLGLAVFSYPDITGKVFFLLIALWILLIGILFVAMAIIVRKESDMEWFLLGIGLVALILGILLLGHPEVSVAIFSIIAGLYTLFSGIMLTSFGFKLKSLKREIKKELKTT